MTCPVVYPYLPKDHDILYATVNNSFMAEAKKIRDTESTDEKNPTGAVLVKEGKILACAANKSKLTNKNLIKIHGQYCIRRLLKVPSGKGYWLCPGCATHKQHAESRLMTEAQKKGLDTNGADVYMYGHWWCCQPCWDAMIKGGVKNVYLVDRAWELFKR